MSKILSEISRNMSESIFAEVFSPKLLGINVRVTLMNEETKRREAYKQEVQK